MFQRPTVELSPVEWAARTIGELPADMQDGAAEILAVYVSGLQAGHRLGLSEAKAKSAPAP